MVRDPVFRARKYDAKMDATVIGARFAAQRDSMVEQEASMFAELYEVERKAKTVCEEAGVSVVQIPMYLSFARQCWKIGKNHLEATRTNEVYYKYLTWLNRGLNMTILSKVAMLCGTDLTKYPAT
jgi:hypothetical protein